MRGILIAGNDSAMLRAVETAAAGRAQSYAAAVTANRFSGLAGSPVAGFTGKARIPLDWNPGSPVSARALVLAAENRLGRIDEALLVCSPPALPCPPEDLRHVDIEVLASDCVKGWLFLAKELAANFKARRHGTLALLYPRPPAKPGADVLAATALSAFASLARWLLATLPGETCSVQAFANAKPGDETGFADFVFRRLAAGPRRTEKPARYGRFPLFR